ncbi:hypothetical protein [Labrys sp. 22185]|uniref:hypothetical protein n=1 Tax=Labrys sp. 22185 TaxID=3453888 RepID=UPI003F8594E7
MKPFTPCNSTVLLAAFVPLFAQFNATLADTLPPDTDVPPLQYTSPLFVTPQDFRTLGAGGAPLPASQNQIDVDEGTLRGWGYMGDGYHHRLFEITNFNGLSSAGWTVAQWRDNAGLIASSVNDEIDGVAVNSIIQKYNGQRIFLHFPKGQAYFSNPVASCGTSVVFQGSGQSQTTLTFGSDRNWKNSTNTGPLLDNVGNPVRDNFINGFNICSSSALGNVTSEDRIELRDLSISQVKVGGNRYGIYAVFRPSKNLNIHSVTFNNFNNCMYLGNAAGSQIEDTTCFSGVKYYDGAGTPIGMADPTVGDGIVFEGGGMFVNHVTNTLVQNYRTGYTIHATGMLEDVSLLNSAAGDAKQCIKIYADNKTYSPLEYNIDNFSCNATSGFVDAQAAGLLTIRGGDWLVAKPFTGAGATWTGRNQDFFRFCRVTDGTLEQAWLSNDNNSLQIGNYVHVYGEGSPCGTQGSASAVHIRDNYFYHANLQYNNLIAVESTADNVIVRDNTFASLYGADAQLPTNAFSWGPSDAGSALYLGQPGEVALVDGEAISVPIGREVTVATVKLAPGRWECAAGLVSTSPDRGSVAVLQGAFNTTSNKLPVAPGYGMSQITSGGALRVGPQVFDLTMAQEATPIYLIGAALHTNTVNLNTNGQCVRLR